MKTNLIKAGFKCTASTWAFFIFVAARRSMHKSQLKVKDTMKPPKVLGNVVNVLAHDLRCVHDIAYLKFNNPKHRC